MDNARIVALSSSRDGVTPGNLICCRGAIYSQTSEGLCRLEPLESVGARLVEQLRRNPDDPETTLALAEVRLGEGDLATAARLVEPLLSPAATPAPRAVQLYGDVLCEGLRIDLAAFAERARRFAAETPDAVTSLRVLEQMLRMARRDGEHAVALDAVFALIDSTPAPTQRRRWPTVAKLDAIAGSKPNWRRCVARRRLNCERNLTVASSPDASHCRPRPFSLIAEPTRLPIGHGLPWPTRSPGRTTRRPSTNCDASC